MKYGKFQLVILNTFLGYFSVIDNKLMNTGFLFYMYKFQVNPYIFYLPWVIFHWKNLSFIIAVYHNYEYILLEWVRMDWLVSIIKNNMEHSNFVIGITDCVSLLQISFSFIHLPFYLGSITNGECGGWMLHCIVKGAPFVLNSGFRKGWEGEVFAVCCISCILNHFTFSIVLCLARSWLFYTFFLIFV